MEGESHERKEIHRCMYCKDSGLVFARCFYGNLYAFKHACNVGRERKENIPYWKYENYKFYEPETNK